MSTLFFQMTLADLQQSHLKRRKGACSQNRIARKEYTVFGLIVRGPEKNHILKISESIIFWIG